MEYKERERKNAKQNKIWKKIKILKYTYDPETVELWTISF